MKELKHVQISKPIWKKLKAHCKKYGYSLKGYVETLIENNIEIK
tara:strand:- start:276 stop:407 length:132 start_codon:yes stop_codon:yes gene_type:complete